MTVDLKRYRQQLQQLVAIPSVSCALPNLDTPNLPVVELLAQWLDTLGFTTRIVPLEQAGKANLIATRGRGEGGLVLSGHSDTVPWDQHRWQSDPFTLTEKNGRFYGLGATDMKGFFPAVLEAVRGFGDLDFQRPLIVLVTADEETSMAGARALTGADLTGARCAVVGEPTGLRPVHMHKGILMEAVRVVGASGHSSNPALGKNALETMHRVIGELLNIRAELQARHRNPGFAVQVPTMNMGCIHGGDGANRICGECEMHFDFRSLPGMDSREIRQLIRRRLTPIAERSGTDIVFSSLVEGVEPFAQDKESELVKVCEQLTGHSAESVAFATEAPFLKQLGLNTLVLGPGSIDQAHQPNEYIDTAQIAPAVEILSALIKRYCLQ